MTNATQSHELPMPELEALRQRIAELELPPDVRQALDKALNQSAVQIRQRLAQVTQHAERLALLGHMAARMTHEIHNPLNAVLLHADVLEEEIWQPTPDHHVQMVESLGEIRLEVTRLCDVVQDYLMLARLVVLECAPQDLEVFLHGCALEMQEQLESRGITLCLKGLARLGYVSLNTGTLRRAMLNLFQRAMDVMPTGGTLTLEGRRAGSQVIVQVSDTGSGIPEEQLTVLFKPFHTAGSEWTTLGLYVVQEIVAAHGGVIDVQSAPGQGTTFTITLPVAPAEAAPQIS